MELRKKEYSTVAFVIYLVTGMVVVSLHIQQLRTSVVQKLDTHPVIFGNNVTLSCYMYHPLKNPKDCPVRQWTIGANTDVLLFNDFAYKPAKYADNTDPNSDHFSLVIMNFGLTDVNRLYSCSCGFHRASKFLSLNGSTFIHKPENSILNFGITNNTLRAELNLSSVFPVPRCSPLIPKHTKDKDTTSNELKNGILFNVSMSFQFNLTDAICTNNVLLLIECNYTAGYTEQHNVSCPDVNSFTGSDSGVMFKTSSKYRIADKDTKLSNKHPRVTPETEAVPGVIVKMLVVVAAAVVMGTATIYTYKTQSRRNSESSPEESINLTTNL